MCRTIGDIEAKKSRFGGNPLVVIADPEINSFKLTLDHDFIFLASNETICLKINFPKATVYMTDLVMRISAKRFGQLTWITGYMYLLGNQ